MPLFLYGHSMGGLVAAHVAARDAAKPRLAGVVLSSAALALPPSASGGARAVVGTLSRLAPELPLEAVDEAQVVREPAAPAPSWRAAGGKHGQEARDLRAGAAQPAA